MQTDQEEVAAIAAMVDPGADSLGAGLPLFAVIATWRTTTIRACALRNVQKSAGTRKLVSRGIEPREPCASCARPQGMKQGTTYRPLRASSRVSKDPEEKERRTLAKPAVAKGRGSR